MARVDQPPTVFAEGDVSESSGAIRSYPSGHLSSGVHASDSYAGQVVDGRYAVERVIGQGGMGVVYAAKHQAIGKRVALKILRVDMAGDREIVERFTNEARAASAVGSPHIVDVTDFGRLPDGSAYFVMEYVEGVSLGDELSRIGTLPLDRVVRLGKQIAKGLLAAHERGVVHRDLKPDNIMLSMVGREKDFIKILDFGIAKLGKSGGKLTKAGAVFGTPHYMAPEQAAGNPVDHRADIYSLGVILYELCAGRVPFDGDNFMTILSQHMHRPPTRLVSLVPGFPSSVDAVISKCLAKSTEQRYQSMAEVLSDLERVSIGMSPDAETSQVSGYFRIPPDYFPSQPRLPSRTATPATYSIPYAPGVGSWGIVGAALGSILLVGIVVVVALTRPKVALPEVRGMTTHASRMSDEPQRDLAHVVRIDVTPADATVVRGDQFLGALPAVPVPVGKEVLLAVSAPGYESAKVTLNDKTNDVVAVHLRRADPRSGAPSTAAPRPGVTAGVTLAAPVPQQVKPRCARNEELMFGKCTKI